MYKIEIEGKFIILPASFSATIRKKMPYLTLSLVGDYAFQFSIPADDITRSIFGNVMLPNIANSSQQSYSARLWYGNYLLFSGFVNLRKANKNSYSIDLSSTPGNINKSMYERKLTNLNLGSYTFPSENITTGIWTMPYSTLADDVNTNTNYITTPYFSTFHNQENTSDLSKRIKHGGVEYVVDWISITRISVDGNVIFNAYFFEDSIVSQVWDDAITAFNDTNTIQIVDINNSINVIMPDTLNHVIKIETRSSIFPVGGGSSTFTEFIPFSIATKISYTRISPDALVEKPNSILCYPPIRNASAYDYHEYLGYVNTYSGGKLKNNNYLERMAYAISPAFNLLELLKIVATYLGFTVETDIDSHPDLNTITLASSRNQDKQCPNLNLPFNIYNPVVTYADYMPDWTVKEFLEACKIQYGVGLDFDEETGIVQAYPISTKLSQTEKQDISYKLGNSPINNVFAKKTYQLKYSSSQDLPRYAPFPSEAVISALESDVQSTELKLLPAMLYSLVTGDNAPAVPIAATEQDYVYFDSRAKSELLAQTDNTVEHGIIYYRGLQSGIYRLTLDGTLIDLRIDGAKGIFNTLLKTYFYFLQNVEEFETSIKLNPLEAAALDITQLYHGYGVDFFIYEIELKLPLKEDSVVRIWR
jgi:hypothetical protein